MSTIGQVHWHEGLFLQPHHLQTMQRDQAESSARERRLTWAYPYGVVDLRLSTDALENMLVRIDRPPAVDIKRVFQASSGAFTVGLAVPLWHPSRANTVEPASNGAGAAGGAARRAVADEARIKRLYRISEITRADENTGENAQPVMVR